MDKSTHKLLTTLLTSRAVTHKPTAALWLLRINQYSYIGAPALHRLTAKKHSKDESQCSNQTWNKQETSLKQWKKICLFRVRFVSC